MNYINRFVTLLLIAFVATSFHAVFQSDRTEDLLLGSWVYIPGDDGLYLEKRDEMEDKKYGLTIFSDGELVRRNATYAWDDEIFRDSPGHWKLSGDTLTLLYEYSSSQKSQEIVLIKHLDSVSMKLERLDWVEIRE